MPGRGKPGPYPIRARCCLPVILQGHTGNDSCTPSYKLVMKTCYSTDVLPPPVKYTKIGANCAFYLLVKKRFPEHRKRRSSTMTRINFPAGSEEPLLGTSPGP